MNLIYTLVNFRTQHYLQMFKVFVDSLASFSNLETFDMLVITDKATKPLIENIRNMKKFRQVYYLLVPSDDNLSHALLDNLSHALLRKFDIAQFNMLTSYDKVLYLDCDIIVQKDVNILFNKIALEKNKLYAMAEGPLTGKYWSLNAYQPSNIERLEKAHVKAFNSGTFLFAPSHEMSNHFKAVKELALSYKGNHFYDQSFMNYYFNTKGLSVTLPLLARYIKLFPDQNTLYPTKVILHFAGLGRYESKHRIMKAYLTKLKSIHTSKDL